MSNIQAVLFDKSKWTKILAKSWLESHNLSPIKAVHETKSLYRYRIKDPRKFNGYFMKILPNGVMLVLGYHVVKYKKK